MDVIVPPATLTVPALVMPVSEAVPLLIVKVPFALIVTSPVVVNAPPVFIVRVAPLPELLIEIVVTVGTLEEISGLLGVPPGIKTALALGTEPQDQLDPVFQSVLVVPSQVLVVLLNTVTLAVTKHPFKV